MELYLCIFITMVVVIKADYHDEVGIPLVAKIKAYEKKLFANPEMQSRIVGGEPSFENAHPYMANLKIQLTTKNVSTCGASLVTTTRLVTAAHCLDRADTIRVRLGSNYMFHGGTRYRTRKFTKHPSYAYKPRSYLTHDIGIVTLPRAVKLSSTIATISLPRTPDDFEKLGEPAIVAGWGLTSDDQHNSSTVYDQNWELSEIVPQIVSEDFCLKEYDASFLRGQVICTDGSNGRGTCDGDSGGPLIVVRPDAKILVGVASFGHPVCELGWSSVFTKTEPYKDFIMN